MFDFVVLKTSRFIELQICICGFVIKIIKLIEHLDSFYNLFVVTKATEIKGCKGSWSLNMSAMCYLHLNHGRSISCKL